MRMFHQNGTLLEQSGKKSNMEERCLNKRQTQFRLLQIIVLAGGMKYLCEKIRSIWSVIPATESGIPVAGTDRKPRASM